MGELDQPVSNSHKNKIKTRTAKKKRKEVNWNPRNRGQLPVARRGLVGLKEGEERRGERKRERKREEKEGKDGRRGLIS